jgi:hypothetical protein
MAMLIWSWNCGSFDEIVETVVEGNTTLKEKVAMVVVTVLCKFVAVDIVESFDGTEAPAPNIQSPDIAPRNATSPALRSRPWSGHTLLNRKW